MGGVEIHAFVRKRCYRLFTFEGAISTLWISFHAPVAVRRVHWRASMPAHDRISHNMTSTTVLESQF